MSRKIAIVVQRYGLEINGGAEYHARLIAEKLSRYFAVEVFTTTAQRLCHLGPLLPGRAGNTERDPGKPFPREKTPRSRGLRAALQPHIFHEEHALADELRWLDEEGPLVPELLHELERREKEFAYFIFFSYRYYHSFHGVKKFARKAILVPTAEHDQVIYLNLFQDFFNLPAAIVYNSPEEKELINRVSGNDAVPGDVVGVGSEIPERFEPQRTLDRLAIDGTLFRLHRPPGREQGRAGAVRISTCACWRRPEADLKLVLVGKAYVPVPEDADIIHVGFQENQEKFDLLAGAEFLVMPSQFESLSMVALEAWAIGKPVLANGRTEVLRGQCRRSHAGLWYSDYDEFRETFLALSRDPGLRERLGANGKMFFRANYSWDVIEAKYLEIISRPGQQAP